MGKGDQKSRRGKITAGSYGKRRPRKAGKSATTVATMEKPVKEAKPKAAPKPKAEKPVEAKAEKTPKAAAEAAESKPKATKSKKTEE